MKERLTGALILVALIVVLVPELLSGPVGPAAHARGAAPSAEEPPLRSYTINLSDEAHGVSGAVRPQPSSPEPATPQAALSQPAAPSPPPAATAIPQPPPRALSPAAAAPASAVHPAPLAAAPVSPPAASGADATGWAVQLGSFANRTNADRLAHQVHALGFPVIVSRGTTGRRLYRVLVGPAHDRAGAEQILSKLRAQGHRGTVVPR